LTVYERPIIAANKKNASSSQKEEGIIVSKELNKITSTFMIRRLQKDILKTLLPPRFETLLFCRPSREQCRLYKELTKNTSDKLTTLTNLRKLCSHPDLLSGEISGNVARSSGAGKLEVLEALLEAIRSENPTDKVVVVSNFTSALTIVDNYILKRRGWPSVRLDGTTEQSSRQPIVDTFNRSSVDHSFVFLLSSKAGGCGLNLIGGNSTLKMMAQPIRSSGYFLTSSRFSSVFSANRLVMLDLDWNPATDAQAMARVYRQGQKKECFIYRLLTTGTVEEGKCIELISYRVVFTN
jgi:SNF2 family DNA or RNA helicase